jgi:branched-chain amino acid transport system ATP-binding protein
VIRAADEAPSVSAPGLVVSKVSVNFGGITALEEVSLEVGEKGVLGVIGPNGAGKTTLFNCICGFVPISSGRIEWCGRALRGTRPSQLAKLGIARTLQGVGLFPRLTVLENVMLGAHRFHRAGLGSALLGASDRDEMRLNERALGVLRRLDCESVSERLPETLPFAIQKRVALARALACEPQLLLLDEPAGGLGASDLSELATLIEELGRSIAVMLVDHHMDLVISVCDTVVVLDFGQVIASGVPPEVRRDPRVMEAYLGREAESEVAGGTHAGG